MAPAVIESCLSRLFLPNARAIEPESREAYARLGLNDRQIETIARAVPKRDYWFQSAAGCRLFELGLGEVALTFCGASAAEDLAAIDRVLVAHGPVGFAAAWLRERGLDWAAALLPTGLIAAGTHPAPGANVREDLTLDADAAPDAAQAFLPFGDDAAPRPRSKVQVLPATETTP